MSEPAQIELTGVDKHYGAYHALKNVSLSIPKGRFVALVGPSGCGKSTLLRSIAGLEKISGGRMRIAGEDVTGVPPRKRDLAMVFQSYALYPHMTVRRNLTYSLRLKRASKAECERAAVETARIIGLENLLDRFPRELSGGQRQRVAMGRAIIRQPKAFLFDEPLSNLDAALRVHMRSEIRKLHDRLSATFIYVTHDQVEAMTMADHVVVLRDGVVEQEGAPLDLYDRPVNRFVAGFIGSPAMNFLDGTVGADGESVALALDGNPTLAVAARRPAGERVTVGLRPEHLMIASLGEAGAFALPVSMIERTGGMSFIVTNTKPELTIAAPGRIEAADGSVRVRVDPGHVHLFDKDSGASLGG
ncbi:ABC transporter ATP-binding protein [Aureimonas leprariae]|uniref:ABC transporter ATP-binding protein n=1 Tax=Plantimonas leprariae TaxID=2615207 RepID=A0A7V7PLS2_9HYPH|nr:ABC transporter ATP-binding protein [Aureimonas leprariae]KAB0677400.1 ABC transporter ATP-binding protein [Aureimonas leprariae]